MRVNEIFEYNLPPATKTTVVVKKPLTKFQKVKKAAQELDIAKKELGKNPFESVVREEASTFDHLASALDNLVDAARNLKYAEPGLAAKVVDDRFVKNKDDLQGIADDIFRASTAIEEHRATIAKACDDIEEICGSRVDEATQALNLRDYSIQDAIETLETRFSAARRGLGLANRLKGEEKKKHLSAVMKNMNTIRNQLGVVITHLQSEAA